MKNKKYQPVACSVHDFYEMAIIQDLWLDLSWFDESGEHHKQRLRPVNIRIIDAAEYRVTCSGKDNESVVEIRLDRIIAVN